MLEEFHKQTARDNEMKDIVWQGIVLLGLLAAFFGMGYLWLAKHGDGWLIGALVALFMAIVIDRNAE